MEPGIARADTPAGGGRARCTFTEQTIERFRDNSRKEYHIKSVVLVKVRRKGRSEHSRQREFHADAVFAAAALGLVALRQYMFGSFFKRTRKHHLTSRIMASMPKKKKSRIVS